MLSSKASLLRNRRWNKHFKSTPYGVNFSVFALQIQKATTSLVFIITSIAFLKSFAFAQSRSVIKLRKFHTSSKQFYNVVKINIQIHALRREFLCICFANTDDGYAVYIYYNIILPWKLIKEFYYNVVKINTKTTTRLYLL